MISAIASRALVRALRPRSYPHFPSPASSRPYSAPTKTWSPRITTASTPKPTVTPLANASTTASNNGDGGLEPDAVPVVAPKNNGTASTPSNPFGAEEQREGDGAQDGVTDWSKSYSGLSSQAFSKEIADILLAPIDPHDVEVKPDGMLYLPEIKYRRVLNRAFGPGGWGLAPRSETNVSSRVVSREYALVCQGRLVAVARGEQEYFDPHGVSTATEACKSNALMRCCKDLGIASELWDPRFIRQFKAQHCAEVFPEHIPTGKKKKLWRRKDDKFTYPYKE